MANWIPWEDVQHEHIDIGLCVMYIPAEMQRTQIFTFEAIAYALHMHTFNSVDSLKSSHNRSSKLSRSDPNKDKSTHKVTDTMTE